MKKQIILIHGGDTFGTYDEYIAFLKGFVIEDLSYFQGGESWKSSLNEKLGDGYEVIQPRMPNSLNAKYVEWKIWFEKLVPFLNDEIIFIGYSLGGIFLAKYLSEETFPKKILGTLLVAAPFDDEGSEENLGDFALPTSIEKFGQQGGEIFIYQSTDDTIVPPANAEKYKNALPNAHVVMLNDRGHFFQKEFPEIVKDITSL